MISLLSLSTSPISWTSVQCFWVFLEQTALEQRLRNSAILPRPSVPPYTLPTMDYLSLTKLVSSKNQVLKKMTIQNAQDVFEKK